MTITEERKTVVLTEAVAVAENRKTGMSFDLAFKEYSRYLAQADIDKDELIAAGLDWPTKEKYNDYRYMLSEVHADRIGAEGVHNAAQEALLSGMEKAALYLATLVLAAKRIIKKSGDSGFKASYKKVKFRVNTLVILKNIIILADLIEPLVDVIGSYKPGKIEVNVGYLELVKAEAHSLIELEAEAKSSGSLRAEKVQLQNQLITLCLDAQDEIVDYAEAAFLTDKDYFNKYYSNQVRKKQYRDSLKEEGETIPEPEEGLPPVLEDEGNTIA